ncbi:MAG: hypothetical protein ACI383_00240 [Rummeliibacillus sp.]
MNKSITTLLLSGCILTLLSGCSIQSSTSNSSHAEAASNTDYHKNYQANPQVTDDRTLLNVGDEITDKLGYAKLKKANLKQKSFEIGDITLTIRDVKQVYLEPTYSMIDYFHVLTHEPTFDVVKSFVEITNNSDKTVHFSPVALLTSNTGQKWTWEQDIYLDDLSGTIEPSQTKRGNIGYILDEAHTSPTKYVLQTSDVFDEKENKIADSKKITLTLPE